MATKSWRSTKRTLLLNVSFLLCFPAFYLGYIGGINNENMYIVSSLALFTIVSVLCMVVKK